MTRFVVLGATLLPLVAHAAFEFEWDAPETCVRPRLSDSMLERSGHAEVLVRRRAEKWVVTVMFFQPVAGLRRVDTTSCEEARQAASLLLRLGSESALPPEQPAPEPELPEAAPPWHLWVGAGGALDFGSLPQPEARVSVSASMSRGMFRGVLDTRWGWPSSLTSSLQVQRLAEAQVAGCVDWEYARLSAGPCVAVAAGSWRVFGSNSSRESWVLSSSVQARALVMLVSGLELSALAGLRFNLRRPVPFTELETLFTTPVVAAELQLALGWRW